MPILALLCVFWLLLSGHYEILILAFGLVSVLLVIWFLRRMDRARVQRRRRPN